MDMNLVSIEKVAATREFYTFKNKNNKGETIVAEISECYNPGGKNSLPYLWAKNGYTKEEMKSYLVLNVYCTQEDGTCFERYNPTIKRSEDNKRNVINFDWTFEVSEENKQKLLDEVYRLAFN